MMSSDLSRTTDICDLCVRTICESNRVWDTHHDRFDDLKVSADNHCIFCSSLKNDIETCVVDPLKLEWPVYRWNLRPAAATRESQEMISVTFRPLYVPLHYQMKRNRQVIPDRIFHFYREHDLGPIPRASELKPTTDQSWDQITKWIETCCQTKEHSRCRPRSSGRGFVPTRLLDIGAIDVHKAVYGNIKVVETKPNRISAEYVTLSHCWGKKPFVVLNRENEEEFKSIGIRWDRADLPKNFKEAIVVARRLKKRYIWIDSLCIVQGKDGDFKNEATLMHQVYRHSFCNIAAADSPDSSGGLFRVRDAKATQYSTALTPATFVPTVTDSVFECYVWRVVPKDLWDTQLLQNTLYTRGWVFQERMLAPRILHFSSNQVFWDCATISACEALPSGLPRPLDITAATDRHWRERLQHSLSLKVQPLAGTADASIEEFWRTAVFNYTSCELTNGNDKFVAIWGVAKLVRDALGELYAAGLWSEKLEEQLAWRVVGCQQANGTVSERPIPLRAPSWSWASVDGIIEVHARLVPEREFKITNHASGDIAFQLKGMAPPGPMRRKIQSPQEEYATYWEAGLKRLQERRRSSQQSTPYLSRRTTGNSDQTTPQLSRRPTYETNQTRTDDAEQIRPQLSSMTSDESVADDDGHNHPELETNELEIQGHVRQGSVIAKDENGEWTLLVDGHVPSVNETDTAVLEVFPDVPPGENYDCWFIVLAYSREQERPFQLFASSLEVADSIRNKSDEESEEDAEADMRPSGYQGYEIAKSPAGDILDRDGEIQWENIDWQQPPLPPPSFSGIGLILRKDDESRYLRMGSFHFREFSETRMNTMTPVIGPGRSADDLTDEERGQKIWLV